MSRATLRQTLGVIVTLAAGCGGKIASTDEMPSPADGSDGGPLIPLAPDECPHTVELRAFDRVVDGSAACSLAAGAPGCFSFACQPSSADCAAACGDPTVNTCLLPVDFLAEFKIASSEAASTDGGVACPDVASPGLELHCAVTATRGSKSSGCPVEGRRPAGWATPAQPATSGDYASIKAYLTQSVWLEAASVRAFDDLANDLKRLGAPTELAAACERAAEEERRHVRSVAALLERFGGVASWPRVAIRPTKYAFEVAVENAVEGEVREVYGAAVALFRAANAGDDEVRSTMLEIAEDECAHAALAHGIGAFLDSLLTPAERCLVAEARVEAANELEAALHLDPPCDVVSVLGVPTAIQARSILALLRARVWQDKRAPASAPSLASSSLVSACVSSSKLERAEA